MMRVLVSVRNVVEARLVAAAGVDFIDLKEPSRGALGDLGPVAIRGIVDAMSTSGAHLSATIGDVPVEAGGLILERVAAVAGCGVDLVKVGLPGRGGAAAMRLLDRLQASGHPLVPVLLADRGLAPEFVDAVVARRFAGVMADTVRKAGGSLLDLCPPAELAHLVATARRAGLLVGVAGALRRDELPRLQALAPDFAGFRSAVCRGGRSTALDPARLSALIRALRTPTPGVTA
ncbi:MAG: (5-formylfuran-3-yl)methyl phosphate synthase [Rhodocyclaceae bacterium]|nr:(5-formylfuran-3-yl)methyl phosphate synthase [Rhodocyclaceae bacterium]